MVAESLVQSEALTNSITVSALLVFVDFTANCQRSSVKFCGEGIFLDVYFALFESTSIQLQVSGVDLDALD